MTEEEKDLLLKDLCARLPYGVFMGNKEWNRKPYQLTCDEVQYMMMSDDYEDVPYLRPMSSMTKEEYNELSDLLKAEDPSLSLNEVMATIEIDWLNKNMFDFRGLIPKDLALSTEVFNPYKD